MPKLKLLILDAGVVIKLHELELWSSIVDAGEAESLAFLVHQNDDYRISSGDAIVYKVLGNLNLGDQGISNIARRNPWNVWSWPQNRRLSVH